jgi:hypothetical protein
MLGQLFHANAQGAKCFGIVSEIADLTSANFLKRRKYKVTGWLQSLDRLKATLDAFAVFAQDNKK